MERMSAARAVAITGGKAARRAVARVASSKAESVSSVRCGEDSPITKGSKRLLCSPSSLILWQILSRCGPVS